MIGLVRKDLYLIVKNLKLVQFIPLLSIVFVAAVMPDFLMLLLSMMSSLICALQVSQSMVYDETTKWPRNITAMPVSHSIEAAGKYLLLLIMAALSAALVIIIGVAAAAGALIAFDLIFVYTGLSAVYVLLYGFIVIPASYRFGAQNSIYILMLFIFLPILLYFVFKLNNISINLDWLFMMSRPLLIALAAIVIAGLAFLSFLLSVRILKKRKYRRT